MRSVLTDAGIGALVTVGLSFLPFSPLLGGAVAANRHGGGYRRGLWMGVLAGVGAMVPLLVLFVPALFLAGHLGFGISPSAPEYEVFLVLVAALFLLYTVGLSAAGGLGGTWVGKHGGWDLEPRQFQ
jgi:hypothetical protein